MLDFISKIAAEIDEWEEVPDDEFAPLTDRSPGTQRSAVSGEEPYLAHESPESAPMVGDIEVLEPPSLDSYGRDAIDVARTFWELEGAANTVAQVLRSNDKSVIENQDMVVQLVRTHELARASIHKMLAMYSKHNPEFREHALQALIGVPAWKT